jgi:hypothetical protein
MAMFSSLCSSTLMSFSGNLTFLLPSRAVTSRKTSPIDVNEWEMAPEIREECCCSRSFSFSFSVSPLLVLLVLAKLVGLGSTR